MFDRYKFTTKNDKTQKVYVNDSYTVHPSSSPKVVYKNIKITEHINCLSTWGKF